MMIDVHKHNGYLRFKIAWKTKMFWVSLACIFLPMLILMIHMISSVNNTNPGDASFVLLAVCFLLMVGGVLAGVIINMINMGKLAGAFGKNSAFAAGLIFLNPIFLCILAFGDAQYIGSSDEQTGSSDEQIQESEPPVSEC